MRSKKRFVQAAVGVLAAGVLLGGGVVVGAQAFDGPNGGPAPSGPRATPASPSESVFVPIAPCRIVDTRVAGGDLAVDTTRSYGMSGDLAAQGGINCGIPASASSLAANVTAVEASGKGFLRVFPAGGAAPNATFLNYGTAFNAGSNGIFTVRSGATPNFQVRTYGSATGVVIDVNGYFVKNLVAVVALDGTLVRGNDVATVVREGEGTYRVNFTRNVSGCAFTGGLNSPEFNSGDLGDILLATNVQNPNGVFVETYNGLNIIDDKDFHLTVSC